MNGEPQRDGGIDRRINPRSPIVVCAARCISGMDVFFGYAVNISRGGAFISTTKYRKPGEVHPIRFTLPGLDRTFECRARVVWLRRYRNDSLLPMGFGLQFLDLPEEDAQAIDDWVGAAEGL